ncbi:MAG: lytic transglycosylase [Gammaproteobacteria bacterium HGW-Gammaproteobacteria-3]|nr:MAG: lytic transglycosylase [Gammaproteobacteria bacterium HGW-Gammaproteobacteria-3]
MIQINSNRSLASLTFLILTLASGCAQQVGKNALNISQKPPVIISDDYSITPNSARFGRSKLRDPAFQSAKKENLNIWQRLVSLYALPEIENERIDREVSWFISHPDYLARVQKRAEPYLHLILEEIESKNIPGELALLPIVESAFKPDAYSSAHASGLWQFIPATGRLYGLQQNNWYDGRRDVYASTQAATSYLKDLSETFDGDWFLALASYNYGKGNVQKSIDRNMANDLPTDYWSLTLPNETFTYVPKLMAVAKIFANPDLYNIPLQDIPNEPYCEVVQVDSQLDLKKAAELANTSTEEIIRLNPAFKRASTAPNGPHRLLIPVDQADIFRENLASLPPAERVAKRTRVLAQNQRHPATYLKHKISRGESIGLIARKYRTSVAAIRKANKLKSQTIQIGQYLNIPVKNVKFKNPTLAQSAPKNQTYTVQKGDTFWKIARQFSVSSDDIHQWNKLTATATLKIGQKLLIKSDARQLASAKSNDDAVRQVRYTVKHGDSLSEISRKFNVTVTNLRKWNSKKVGKYLKPGQQLTVVLGKTT